jgi:hypothetical protein
MTTKRPPLTGCILLLAATLLAAGCVRTQPAVEYYTLAPLAPAQPAAAARPDFHVAVRPVSIPDILERPQIVTRTGDNRVSVSDTRRWAGTLKKDFTRVLVENLNVLLREDRGAVSTDDIVLDPDFLVAVSVNRFDGGLAESVWLSSVWSVKPQKGKKELEVRKSMIAEATRGPGYEELVAAHDRAAAALSREIAGEIRRLRAALP